MRKSSLLSSLILSCMLSLAATSTPALAEDNANTAPNVPTGPTVGPCVTGFSTPAASVAPDKGVFSTTINYSYSDKDTWYEGGNASSTSRRTVANVATLKLRYGLGNNWDVRTATPFMWLDIKGAGTKQGMGDTSIVFRNRFLRQEEDQPLSLSAGFGFVVPTGDTGSDGVGAGAFGLHGEVGATYEFDNRRQLIEGGLIYIWVGEGGGQGRHGDQADNFRAHARYAYALDERWSLGLETVYNYYTDTEINGVGQDNAKYGWFGGPAVTYKIPEWKMVLGASVQASLYQDTNPVGGVGEKACFEFKLMKVF